MDRLIDETQAGRALAGLPDPDVAVVGSGPSGAVAAVALAKRGFNVLLIDCGGTELRTDAAPFFDFDAGSSSHQVSYGMSMQLGGSTNLWAGRSARFEADDISIARGWPFEIAELDDVYSRAEQIMVVSQMLWKFPGRVLRACEGSMF